MFVIVIMILGIAILVSMDRTFRLDLIPPALVLRPSMPLPRSIPSPSHEPDIRHRATLWRPQSNNKDHLTLQVMLLASGLKGITSMEALSIPVKVIHMVPGHQPAILRLDLGSLSGKTTETVRDIPRALELKPEITELHLATTPDLHLE